MSADACAWITDQTVMLAFEFRNTTDHDRRNLLLDALTEVVRLAVEQA